MLVLCFATMTWAGQLFKQLQGVAAWMESRGMDPAISARVASLHLSFAQMAAMRLRGQEGASTFSSLVIGLTPGGITVQVLEK